MYYVCIYVRMYVYVSVSLFFKEEQFMAYTFIDLERTFWHRILF